MFASQHRDASGCERQKGAILFLVAAAMVVLLGMAGLAFDLGSLYNAKTEIQNACDAAALAGAWRLNRTGQGINDAVTDALAAANKFHFNNQPIALANSDITFSDQRDGTYVNAAAAIGNAVNIRFVRAGKSTVMPLNLIRIIPGIQSTQPVAAFAVAGPSRPLNNICDGLLPIAFVPEATGYTPGTFYTFSRATSVSAASPGKYLVIEPPLPAGPLEAIGPMGRCIALATCPSTTPDTTVDSVDPAEVQVRLNDRFQQDTNLNIYAVGAGPSMYGSYVTSSPPGNGRRVFVVAFVSSSSCAFAPPTSSPVYVLNYGCFFMREAPGPVPDVEIRGEFIDQCNVQGYFPDPGAPQPPLVGSVPGVTKLVLQR